MEKKPGDMGMKNVCGKGPPGPVAERLATPEMGRERPHVPEIRKPLLKA
jgi:hypothetical protein